MRAVKANLGTPLKVEGRRSGTPGAEEGMESDDLLCSRNARPQKALVGRAQGKLNQPPSLKRRRASLEGSFSDPKKGQYLPQSKLFL
jgi:hypothetical protein